MADHDTELRDLLLRTLLEAFPRNLTPYDPEDLADFSCNRVFRADDGMLAIRALTFGEVVDALIAAGVVCVPPLPLDAEERAAAEDGGRFPAERVELARARWTQAQLALHSSDRVRAAVYALVEAQRGDSDGGS